MNKTIWWLNPAWIFSLIMIPNITIANFLSNNAYMNYWGTPKYFNQIFFVNSFIATVLFVIGSSCTTFVLNGIYKKKRMEVKQQAIKIDNNFLINIFNATILLTFFGYAYWLYAAFKRGLSLEVFIEMLKGSKGAMYDLKYLFSTVSGITTFTQFGIVAVIVGVLIGFKIGWGPIKAKLIILLIVTLIRAFFLSERLAMIEVIIPMTICIFGIFAQKGLRGKMKLIINIFPVIGIIIMVLYFSISEYFRSWINYYSQFNSSFFEFCLTRLTGYYVTALNNGSMLINVIDTKLKFPFYSTEWLWKFPVIGSYFNAKEMTGLPDNYDYSKTLMSLANPEYNNPSGIFLPMLDYGVFGGLLFWLVIGMICGFIYHLFITNNIYGYLFYPALYTGLLETPRILYWTQGRTFPVWLILITICIFLAINNKKFNYSRNEKRILLKM